ncbi:MAG: sterol desaturase family protein [Pseudomonadota bacterium]
MELESVIRLTAFSSVLVLMILIELFRPRRRNVMRSKRWPANFGVILIYSLILVVLPVTPIDAALQSVYWKFGLFYWIDVSFWWSIILSVILLDMLIYWQHRIFHTVPLLWRLHRMHHSDPAIDVTTGFRFHPIEIVLSVLIKVGAIVLLGAPILAVLIFEVVLNTCAMFNHSNIRIPVAFDKILRWLIVTPDMHRVHHSTEQAEHNSNFGFNLSIWDRLFASYTDQPAGGHQGMKIGLEKYQNFTASRLDRLLLQPFR